MMSRRYLNRHYELLVVVYRSVRSRSRSSVRFPSLLIHVWQLHGRYPQGMVNCAEQHATLSFSKVFGAMRIIQACDMTFLSVGAEVQKRSAIPISLPMTLLCRAATTLWWRPDNSASRTRWQLCHSAIGGCLSSAQFTHTTFNPHQPVIQRIGVTSLQTFTTPQRTHFESNSNRMPLNETAFHRQYLKKSVLLLKEVKCVSVKSVGRQLQAQNVATKQA